jgi:hypothetical protein
MGAVATIAAIAVPFAREIIVAWMEASGKTSITIDDLKTLSPDELLAGLGIKLDP